MVPRPKTTAPPSKTERRGPEEEIEVRHLGWVPTSKANQLSPHVCDCLSESLEKSAKKEASSPSKRNAQKWEDDRHQRSRSRTGERDKGKDKDWESKGEDYD